MSLPCITLIEAALAQARTDLEQLTADYIGAGLMPALGALADPARGLQLAVDALEIAEMRADRANTQHATAAAHAALKEVRGEEIQLDTPGAYKSVAALYGQRAVGVEQPACEVCGAAAGEPHDGHAHEAAKAYENPPGP